MKLFIKIGKSILLVCMLLLLLMNIVNLVQMVVFKQEMPMVLGYGKAVVITGSMEPAITAGDMVIIKEQDDYEVGDIVVYKGNSYITHRIVEKTETGFITQGDANNVDDGEILRRQMVGKVILVIPKIGFAVDFLKSPFGILLIVLLMVAMIELPNHIGKQSKRR